jgi:hypothetical protein
MGSVELEAGILCEGGMRDSWIWMTELLLQAQMDELFERTDWRSSISGPGTLYRDYCLAYFLFFISGTRSSFVGKIVIRYIVLAI